jgi:hypothetical protein
VAQTTDAEAPADNPTLAEALWYLRQGFSIIPLVPSSKRPAVPWKEYQERRPTEDEVRAWVTGTPDRGIGLVTGAVSGLVVLDCDVRNGGDNDELRRLAPSALVAQTGGGGIHVYCQHPATPVSCGTIRQGIDRKGDGGYVVAPPSVHPNGTRYA